MPFEFDERCVGTLLNPDSPAAATVSAHRRQKSAAWRERVRLGRQDRGAASSPASGGRSVGVGVAQEQPEGAHQDFEIEPEAVLVDVFQIEIDALAQLLDGVQLTAVAVDLREAG